MSASYSVKGTQGFRPVFFALPFRDSTVLLESEYR